MNIYFCREKHEYAGLFVVAMARGIAKRIFADEVGCEYTDVRSSIRKRSVPEFYQGCLFDDSILLERYGLKYDYEEE